MKPFAFLKSRPRTAPVPVPYCSLKTQLWDLNHALRHHHALVLKGDVEKLVCNAFAHLATHLLHWHDSDPCEDEAHELGQLMSRYPLLAVFWLPYPRVVLKFDLERLFKFSNVMLINDPSAVAALLAQLREWPLTEGSPSKRDLIALTQAEQASQADAHLD